LVPFGFPEERKEFNGLIILDKPGMETRLEVRVKKSKEIKPTIVADIPWSLWENVYVAYTSSSLYDILSSFGIKDGDLALLKVYPKIFSI